MLTFAAYVMHPKRNTPLLGQTDFALLSRSKYPGSARGWPLALDREPAGKNARDARSECEIRPIEPGQRCDALEGERIATRVGDRRNTVDKGEAMGLEACKISDAQRILQGHHVLKIAGV